MRELSKADRKLLVCMLDRLHERQVNAGCNDFDLAKDSGLRDDEWPAVAVQMNRARAPVDRAISLSSWSFSDIEIVEHLQRLLKEG